MDRSELSKTKYLPAEDKEKATDHKTRGKNIYLPDKLEFIELLPKTFWDVQFKHIAVF